MPFPKAIDSTILHAFKACPELARLQYIENLTQKGGLNIHLIAGIAFAKGLEVARRAFFEGATTQAAEAAGLAALLKAYGDPAIPERVYKTWDRVSTAFVDYLDKWPVETDYLRPLVINGAPCFEFTFAFPLPINNPDTGDPILYAGRCDWIATYQGSPFVVDEKTTSAMGPNWSRQWELRGQFAGYSYAARLYGYPVIGTIVRGVAIKKESIDLNEAIIYHPDWKMDRWYQSMLRSVQRLVTAYTTGEWELNLGDSCNAYGQCPMYDICKRQDPTAIIEADYTKREWNPLLKDQD